MKQTFLTALCAVLSWLTIHAQIDTVKFDDNIPANWPASATSILSLSADHLKGGTHALKWAAGAGDTLNASTLGIGTNISASSHFFIYSQIAGDDTLIVQFLDNTNTVQREGHVLLNFSGWREYHRNLLDDYNFGASLPRFNLQGFRIIYHPATPGAPRNIWLDEVMVAGFGEARTPGPHMLLDHQHFAVNPEDGPAGNALESWLHTPDIAATTATGTELTDLATVRNAWHRDSIAVSPGDVTAARNYVTGCNISRNTDSSIKGRPQPHVTIYHTDTLNLLSRYCGVLANAWLVNHDTVAKTQLLLFTEYLLDLGLAEGGRNVLLTNDYKNIDTFATGFLQALPVYPTSMRRDVIRMLRWSHEYNKIYQPTITPGLNEDYLYKKTPYLYELACADITGDSAVRDLKCLSRWLEQNTLAGQGGRDGVKPDGTAFHHNAHYISYMQAFKSWIKCAYNVSNTTFHISQTAYTNISNVIRTLFLETSRGTIFGNADCGRKPFSSSIPIDTGDFHKLVTVGGRLASGDTDPVMAAAYNYFYNTNYYTSFPAANMDGYYAFNYAQLGIFRKNGWTVDMRGFTDKLFGTEIYPTENRYGRYQSYGAVEVLYNGNLTGTGYRPDGAGWDWNVIPGATTVHLPYTSLNPHLDKTEEHQLGSFTGALSLGKDGIFGMDFTQDTAAANYATNNLRFHKSVFAFDTILVCLGSGINASTAGNKVATNLFQAIVTDTPQLILDSNSLSFPYSNTMKIDSPGHWLINARSTGYYIPKGNDSLVMFQGQQTTPDESDSTGNITNTINASKVWLTHGSTVSNARYHFAIVPNVTPAKMKPIATLMSQNAVYKVLSQTDTVHAVRYLSSHLNSYVFFQPASNVNIGFVKSISGKALLGARENGDTLTLSIADPDLHTIGDSISYWRSTSTNITLTVKGSWNLQSNPGIATITSTADSLIATFTLQDGFPATLTLVNSAADSSRPGVWTNQYPSDSSWNYGFGRGSLGVDAFAGTSITSVSPGSGGSNGYLANPPSGTVKVSIGSSGTPRFDLVDSSRQLRMTASSTATIGRFSTYGIGHATPVASVFFTFTLNDSPSTDSVDWIFAIGKTGTSFFNGSSGFSNTGTNSTPDVFSALKWSINGNNRNLVSFRFRDKKTTATAVSYPLVTSSFFQRGGTYKMEIYANAGRTPQTYVRGITTYTVIPRTYHVWANNTQLSYQGNTGFPANEMVADSTLAACLFDSKLCGSFSGGVLTGNNSATMTLAHTLQINYAQPNGPTGLASIAGPLTTSPLTLTSPATRSGFRLMPNPAHDYIQLLYTVPKATKTTINIVSVSGQVVLRKEVWLSPGENYISLNIAGLPRGLYSVNRTLLLIK